MMQFDRWRTIASLLVATVAFQADAASITYTGLQKVGAIAADYSFVTDGSLGVIDYSNFTSYTSNSLTHLDHIPSVR